MDPSFVAATDEAGDEGFEFANSGEPKKSSEWFVISAAVYPAASEPRVINVVDAAREKLRRTDDKPFHFRHMRHDHRIAFAREVRVSKCCAAVSIVIYKPEISDLHQYRKPHGLYEFATQLLIERVSHLCFDWLRHPRGADIRGDGTVRFMFSEKRNLSAESLRRYTESLAPKYNTGIYWRHIDPQQIETRRDDQHRALEIADLFASATYLAFEPHQLGHTENRYARELVPLAYRRNGRILGHGVKVYPSSAMETVPQLAPFLYRGEEAAV